MTLTGWIQIVVLVGVLTGLTPVLGGYMARVYQGEDGGPLAARRILGPVERTIYRVFRVDDAAEQSWTE